MPVEFHGLDLFDVDDSGLGERPVGVVHDRVAGTVSLTVAVSGRGFSVADPDTQDRLVEGWGAVLSPFARERCPVSKVVWQQWSSPGAMTAHAGFLTGRTLSDATVDDLVARADYDELVAVQTPDTLRHEVLVTIVVDLARVRARRKTGQLDAAVTVLLDETRLFLARLDTAELQLDRILTGTERAIAVRRRSNPTVRAGAQLDRLAQSLAKAAGRATVEWGPMSSDTGWGHHRVDQVWHRSYRVASWPMLPVGADWMSPLLTGAEQVTRTVTVVYEPVPMRKAAHAANRELASLEADAAEKQARQFRVTARERRRMTDVETRERELAVGHAEFGFVGLVTVTAVDLDALDDACANVEQAAAQALLDLRPLDARHHLGYLASLPLGRDIRKGRWT